MSDGTVSAQPRVTSPWLASPAPIQLRRASLGFAVPELRIGTSGYHYEHWRGRLYPPELARDRWLTHYAGRFDTVEIDSTFYGLPDPSTIRRWRDCVPQGFRFAVKISR